MLPFDMRTVGDTDYIVEITDTTNDSKVLEHLFKFVVNRERQVLKRTKGVALPDIDYKKLKKWSTKELGQQELKVLKIAFNKPTLAHYKNVLKDISDQVYQDKVKILDCEFNGMSFEKLLRGWRIKVEFVGHYTYEG